MKARGTVGLSLRDRSRGMVYLADEGSEFDAPIDVVWKYLTEGSAHDRVHRSTRNGRFEPLTHSSFTYAAEREVDGAWQAEAMRITVLEPVAIATVFLEGPFAGSKMVYVYKPRGARTGIDVYGDFTSASLAPERLERAIRSMLDTEFREDAGPIARLAASR